MSEVFEVVTDAAFALGICLTLAFLLFAGIAYVLRSYFFYVLAAICQVLVLSAVAAWGIGLYGMMFPTWQGFMVGCVVGVVLAGALSNLTRLPVRAAGKRMPRE